VGGKPSGGKERCLPSRTARKDWGEDAGCFKTLYNDRIVALKEIVEGAAATET
jgi:hypothetical protein